MSEQEILESLVEYLIQESYVDNEESALVLIENVSNETLEQILIEFKVDGKNVVKKTGGKLGSKVAQRAAKKGLSKFIPGVGTAMGIKDAVTRAKQGDYVGAAISGVSAIPGPVGWAGTAVDIARGFKSPKEVDKDSKPEPKAPPKQPKTSPDPSPSPTPKPEPSPTPQRDPAPAPKPSPTPAPSTPATPKSPGQKKKVGVPVGSPTGQDKSGVGAKSTGSTTRDATRQDQTQDQRQKQAQQTKKGTTQKTKPQKRRNPRNWRLPSLGGSISGGTTRALGGHISKARDPNESFEMVCDFLIQEGYAETGPQAEAMYYHMSHEWKDYILG